MPDICGSRHSGNSNTLVCDSDGEGAVNELGRLMSFATSDCHNSVDNSMKKNPKIARSPAWMMFNGCKYT